MFPPRILLIDSYDSFTHNLAHLLRRNIPGCQIHLIRNDTINYASLLPLLPYFSAIVVGPGPGSPANDSDIGFIKELWSLPESHLLPIFGVCLGFQSFVLAYGGSLRTMRVVKHGMISRIRHRGRDIFHGIAEIEATRYHSLCVDLESQESRSAIDPLAWADDGEENGQVLMAARHRTKPFWGVQYHPESICTRGCGREIIRNFWKMSLSWCKLKKRRVPGCSTSDLRVLGDPWPHRRPTAWATPHSSGNGPFTLSSMDFDHLELTVSKVCEVLGVRSTDTNFVVLESAAKPGRFTIIGVPLPSTLNITYFLPETSVVLQNGNEAPRREYFASGSTIWDWLANFMASRKISSGNNVLPFWGGLVGYLSYELGVAELGIPLKHRLSNEKRNADVNLTFVERSIVIDRETGSVHVQSLVPCDDEWLLDVGCKLTNLTCPAGALSPRNPTAITPRSRLISPQREVYVTKVKQCKDHLAVGSSYELCLTAPSKLCIPSTPSLSPWGLYKQLRRSNPAPYSAYLRLGGTTLLCSSPERFLKWDRAGKCEMRPMKGTLPKVVCDKDGQRRVFSREDANELLCGSVKERAENLMIVDLVRHDLGGVIETADGVEVETLMGIEEYETVWQMVSTITGKVTTPGHQGGLEVLRRSLPPGSMTGAPKKRSVELLQDIEEQERGVYSGVCGYWCVGDSADWAVIIRSCFRQESDKRRNKDRVSGLPSNDQNQIYFNNTTQLNGVLQEEEWTVGAGGAITALSDPVGEWKEMQVKLGSVGRAFGVLES